MTSYTTAKAKTQFDELIESVSKDGKPARITRGRKVVAGVVAAEDLELLERIRAAEDAEDIREAKKALAEYKRKPNSAEPWKKVKKELGL